VRWAKPYSNSRNCHDDNRHELPCDHDDRNGGEGSYLEGR